MNVLLVDDEAPALRELSDAVSAVLPGARTWSFAKAAEAMEFARTTPVEIAFLDIHMRFMDGIAMARQLLTLYPACNIIFCTGYEEYALDAHDTYCSGYLLKPISAEKIETAMKHLRHPLPRTEHRVELHCFGNFDVLCDGKPVAFKYKKTRELLAYLTDRGGAEATTREIMAAIFEEDKASYFSNIRLDLLNTFASLGVPEVISCAYGRIRVVRDQVTCDYFDYLDGKDVPFLGEYMTQYSFAEYTCGALNDRLNKK
ncbi:MAG: response regulator [Ruminococcus sp.]|nr:response regulator [Candidatus Apopatosoma intestinale]